MRSANPGPLVAIGCGGTGGHLFPGLAISEEILFRGGRVTLLVSKKDIDQQIASGLGGMDVVTLPAVGLVRGAFIRFVRNFFQSLSVCRRHFVSSRPSAILAMGGFTSAAPVVAGRRLGLPTFLHEANSIPGRANRWLAHWVDEAFVSFHEASSSLNLQKIEVVGMPVRSQFVPMDPASPRMAMGLDPARATLLIMGGSQGASGINDLVCAALSELAERLPRLQFIHLTGEKDFPKVSSTYRQVGCRAIVRPFLTEMELALGAATLTISRSGASSLAEQAAMNVPAILIPFPSAADNHQFYNAESFVESGAALLLVQKRAKGTDLIRMVVGLLEDEARLAQMRQAMGARHMPDAAKRVAERILEVVAQARGVKPRGAEGSTGHDTVLRPHEARSI